MLIIAGLPLMFMELSFGQYAALGPVAIYRRFCPLFRGLGTGMVIVSAIVMLYYNLIIAWTLFYMSASFRTELPWQNCEPEWSTKNCYSYEMADKCEANNGTYYLRICYNFTYAEAHNIPEMAANAIRRAPAEEYFNNNVLGLSTGIEETGGIKISLALCLFCAWVIVFLCLCKGVQSSGKVVYFTALFPYIVLVILFVRGVTLPGARTGILFYLTPDWKQLANAQVWGDAAVQIFFALSPAWGGLITLSSYNKFHNNCYKDSLIVAICNIGTSFFAGLVIFSIIGFLAHELEVNVEKVVDQGAGLAFIVYPEVVTRLPISPVWSVLFFVMLLTLGLDSQFALMETVTTAILDKFPNLRQHKTWVVLFVGVMGYLGGLGFTTRSGMYWLQLMDKYAANWSVLLIAISECVLIAWIYGSQRFLNDIQEMIGKRSHLWNIFWSTMWRYITPATLLFILFFNWVEYKPATYGHYIYPLWADTVGWIIGLLPVLIIFVAGIEQFCKAPNTMSCKQRFKYLLKPTAKWGPAGMPCNYPREQRYQSESDIIAPNTSIITETGTPAKLLASDTDNLHIPHDDHYGDAGIMEDEVLQLCERVNASTSTFTAATSLSKVSMTTAKTSHLSIAHNTHTSNGREGILKTNKFIESINAPATEHSFSRNVKPYEDISKLSIKVNNGTASKQTANKMLDSTEAIFNKSSCNNKGKIVIAGTSKCGRELKTMSTFYSDTIATISTTKVISTSSGNITNVIKSNHAVIKVPQLNEKSSYKTINPSTERLHERNKNHLMVTIVNAVKTTTKDNMKLPTTLAKDVTFSSAESKVDFTKQTTPQTSSIEISTIYNTFKQTTHGIMFTNNATTKINDSTNTEIYDVNKTTSTTLSLTTTTITTNTVMTKCSAKETKIVDKNAVTSPYTTTITTTSPITANYLLTNTNQTSAVSRRTPQSITLGDYFHIITTQSKGSTVSSNTSPSGIMTATISNTAPVNLSKTQHMKIIQNSSHMEQIESVSSKSPRAMIDITATTMTSNGNLKIIKAHDTNKYITCTASTSTPTPPHK